MASTELVPAERSDLSREQIDLIKQTVAKGTTDEELKLFLYTARRTGLDPLAKQVYAIKRWNATDQRMGMAIQTGIDGYRLIAERTGRYAGQDGPFWCGEDGIWKDVWLSKDAPLASKIGIRKQGFHEPLYRVALMTEYRQTKKDGSPTDPWKRMPTLMLAKCAEAVALRAAFPQELSGIYTHEEMEQADSEVPAQATPRVVDVTPQPKPAQIAAPPDYAVITDDQGDKIRAAAKKAKITTLGPLKAAMLKFAGTEDVSRIPAHMYDFVMEQLELLNAPEPPPTLPYAEGEDPFAEPSA